MLTAFIDDGYNRDGTIKEEPGRWPEIHFTYRPFSTAQVVEQVTKGKHLDDASWHRMVAGQLAKNLVSWDIKNSRGESVEITADNLMRLAHPVLMRIHSIVGLTEKDDGEGNLQRV